MLWTTRYYSLPTHTLPRCGTDLFATESRKTLSEKQKYDHLLRRGGAEKKAMTKLDLNSPAPDFTLPDGDGKQWRLSAHRGKVVVLLFYPGDETPVCTAQMCSVRDRWEDYVATGAEVVGISSDSVESHRKFSAHHNLPLRLLSDKDGEVSRLYGARSLIPGKVARSVFVIDANGLLRYADIRPIGLFKPKDDVTLAAIKSAMS
jgi:thioredoxin-dependent peroxiredoxin